MVSALEMLIQTGGSTAIIVVAILQFVPLLGTIVKCMTVMIVIPRIIKAIIIGAKWADAPSKR